MGAASPPRAPAFALTIPGIGPMLRSQAKELGLRPARVEFDGRADIVPLGRADDPTLARLRTAEDVFVGVAVLRRMPTAGATASQLDRAAVVRALDHLQRGGGTVDRTSFRVVVRVLDERRYTRTGLRAAVIARVRALLPTWRPAQDGAGLELWVLQVGPAAYRVGIRLAGASRRGQGRLVERQGALRPAVAAAMVHLAGRAGAGLLVDPCCGSGTILAEARAAGWSVAGGDRDVGAVQATVANTGIPAALLDARRLPLADDVAQTVVTNLPFGSRYTTQGVPVAWYRRVLSEALRVAASAVVLAAPTAPFRQALGRLPVELRARHDIVLLGHATTIWVLERLRSRP